MAKFSFIFFILMSVFLIGCQSESKTNVSEMGAEKAKTSVKICGSCGELKGDAKCCKPEGRKACGGCGLFKGAVGCCKLHKGDKDATLCSGCGEIKGGKKCCKAEGREKCKKCDLYKGSVGCCKIKSKTNDK